MPSPRCFRRSKSRSWKIVLHDANEFIYIRTVYNIYICIYLYTLTTWSALLEIIPKPEKSWHFKSLDVTSDIWSLGVDFSQLSSDSWARWAAKLVRAAMCSEANGYSMLQCYSQSIGLLSPKSKLEAQWLSTIIGSIYIYLVIQSQNIGHCEVVAPPDEPQGKRLPWPGIFLKWWDFRYFEMPRAKKFLKICL